MRFKAWIELNEVRYKGFQRQFRNNYRELPDYVAHQLYTNRFGVDLGKLIQQQQKQLRPTIDHPSDPTRLAATMAYTPAQTPSSSPKPSPQDILTNSDYLHSIQWLQKPVVLSVSPSDFDKSTLDLFMAWRFGFNPKDHAVRNDSQRFDKQRELMIAKPDGSNEPVILVKDGNKYKLIEGFHRTMLYLLSPHDPNKGAPPDQIEALKQGLLDGLDFNKWRKVPITVYLGVRKPFNMSGD